MALNGILCSTCVLRKAKCISRSKRAKRLILPENRGKVKPIANPKSNQPCRLCLQSHRPCRLVSEALNAKDARIEIGSATGTWKEQLSLTYNKTNNMLKN
jgi:hypothetical protein